MDQDIRFQVPLTVAASTGTAYFATPYRSVLRDVRAIPQAAMSSASSVAVTVTASIDSTSTSLGSVAFAVDSSSDAAVGVPGTYTPDASSGSTILAAGQVVKFNMASSAANASQVLDIELDPYARKL